MFLSHSQLGRGRVSLLHVYQLSTIYYDRVTCKSIAVVISPLNTLMEDQVARFSSRRMSAACVGTQCSAVLAEKIMDGDVQLIYMSPETVLTSPAWREIFRNQQFRENVVCLAHLIEIWYVCARVCGWCYCVVFWGLCMCIE